MGGPIVDDKLSSTVPNLNIIVWFPLKLKHIEPLDIKYYVYHVVQHCFQLLVIQHIQYLPRDSKKYKTQSCGYNIVIIRSLS